MTPVPRAPRSPQRLPSDRLRWRSLQGNPQGAEPLLLLDKRRSLGAEGRSRGALHEHRAGRCARRDLLPSEPVHPPAKQAVGPALRRPHYAEHLAPAARQPGGSGRVDWDRYSETDYERTQEIGAALSLLGCDGLLAPSARWPCENLILLMDNQAPGSCLEVLSTEEIDWVAWARANRLLPVGNAEG